MFDALFTKEVVELSTVSFAIAIASLVLFRRTSKTSLIYLHFTALILPFIAASLNVNCTMGFLPALLGFCATLITSIMVYFVPPLIIVSIILGYIFMPNILKKHHKAIPF